MELIIILIGLGLGAWYLWEEFINKKPPRSPILDQTGYRNPDDAPEGEAEGLEQESEES